MTADLKRLKRDTSKISRASLQDMPVPDYSAERAKAETVQKTAIKPLWIVTDAAAVIILILAGFFGRSLFQGQEGYVPIKEKSVAVMYFENRTGVADLGKNLVSMLTSILSE